MKQVLILSYILAACLFLSSCGRVSDAPAPMEQGGIIVGNPLDPEVSYKNYTSPHGYSIEYRSELKLKTSGDDLSLETVAGSASELRIDVLGDWSDGNDLVMFIDLSKAEGFLKFDKIVSKETGELRISYRERIGSKVIENILIRTPNKKLLRVRLIQTDRDKQSDFLAAALKSIEYDLTSPKISQLNYQAGIDCESISLDLVMKEVRDSEELQFKAEVVVTNEDGELVEKDLPLYLAHREALQVQLFADFRELMPFESLRMKSLSAYDAVQNEFHLIDTGHTFYESFARSANWQFLENPEHHWSSTSIPPIICE